MCVYYITWLVKTQKSTTEWSFVKVVVLKLTIVIWDRNGPIINLDASARSASLIFLLHQRFLLLQNVYFLIFFLKSRRAWPPCHSPRVGPARKTLTTPWSCNSQVHEPAKRTATVDLRDIPRIWQTYDSNVTQVFPWRLLIWKNYAFLAIYSQKLQNKLCTNLRSKG